MLREKAFEYTVNQKHLHNINSRIKGLRSSSGSLDAQQEISYKQEISRMNEAWIDIRDKMTQNEFDQMEAHENRILSTAEIAAEAKAVLARMSENRDSNSI